jgi:hypothetical protein
MSNNSFPYSYWAKILGLLIIVAGIASFIFQYQKRGFFDLNELGVGFSWGLVFIFFSKENNDDEMIHSLKFRALSKATIISFFITHLFNYLFLNWHFNRERDHIMSISAYQFLALTLIIATGLFYYERAQLSKQSD